MKIAILSQPLHNNYGGLLQNYALQQVLKKMGYEVETINWNSRSFHPFKDWIWRRKRFILSYIRKGVEKAPYYMSKKEFTIISRNTRQFIENNISLCPVFVTKAKMFKDIDKRYRYDTYIVGSDQVWRPMYNPMQTSMFLDFLTRNDVNRIAYAASFGTSDWTFDAELSKTCAQLAKRFDTISVREKSGVDLCMRYFGVEAKQVLDPTLLLDRKVYEKLIAGKDEKPCEGELFYYFLDLDDDKKRILDTVADRLNMKPFTVMPKYQSGNRTKKNVKNHIEDCVFNPVEDWLQGFKNSKMVLVDSFHGVIFAIIFNKPFWVIGNSLRGNTRFESILSLFGLQDRFIDNPSLADRNWDTPIDWNKVNDIKEKETEQSINLLRNAIRNRE